MSDVDIVEGHPVVPDPDRKMLQPGAQARIYRDGGVLEGAVLVPTRGPLELRHLAPGSYVLKDETGGYEEVAIHPQVETTVVPTAMSRRARNVVDGTAEPGSSFTVPAPRPPQALKPIYPPQGDETELEAPPQEDVPVPGEPGSALIQEIEDPDAYVDFQLASLRGDLPSQQQGFAGSDFNAEPPAEQLPDKPKQEEPTVAEVPEPVVIDDRKRPVDPSVPDPKAAEIAGTVLPSEQVTEDPAPVTARRKQARTAKPRSDG